MYSLKISSAARNDTADAEIWYHKQQPELGNEFLKDVFNSLDYISGNPSLLPIRFSGNFRFSKLSRFPFLIVYEIVDDFVVINAVFHTSRNPSRF